MAEIGHFGRFLGIFGPVSSEVFGAFGPREEHFMFLF